MLKLIEISIHTGVILQHMSPRWYIRNFDDHGVRMVHL